MYKWLTKWMSTIKQYNQLDYSIIVVLWFSIDSTRDKNCTITKHTTKSCLPTKQMYLAVNWLGFFFYLEMGPKSIPNIKTLDGVKTFDHIKRFSSSIPFRIIVSGEGFTLLCVRACVFFPLDAGQVIRLWAAGQLRHRSTSPRSSTAPNAPLSADANAPNRPPKRRRPERRLNAKERWGTVSLCCCW